jgi:hypothetical protein
VKKLMLVCFIVVIVIASVVFAAETGVVTIRGDIIDNVCAGSQTAASGYAIFDGTDIYRFDQASNARVEAFLREKQSKLQVVVAVKKEKGNMLDLVSITNQ